LATFVSGNRYTRTRFLTFDTTATHFTFARTWTTANAFFGFYGAFIIAQFIQFHVASPFAGTTLSSDRLGKHGVIHERGNIPTRAQIYAQLMKCKLIPKKYVIPRA
jgi:hypothetical protein